MEKFPVTQSFARYIRIYRCIMLYYEYYRFNGGCLLVHNKLGTRSWHFSSNWFRGRPLKLIVRTLPIDLQPPKSIVWIILFNWQHQKSIVCTTPFNRQHPKPIVWTIPTSRQHPKSTVWTTPIIVPAPEINCRDNSGQFQLIDSLRNQLFRQFQFKDNTRNLLLTPFSRWSLKSTVWTFPVNRQSPKSIVCAIPIKRHSTKPIVRTIPINTQPPKSIADTIIYWNRNCPRWVEHSFKDGKYRHNWIAPNTAP